LFGLALVGSIYLLGHRSGVDATAWIAASKQSSWAPAIVVLAYIALAFASVPQFALVTATGIVFGPQLGLLYSWSATLISALFTYALGRRLGQRLLARWGGARWLRIRSYLAQHGLLATILVRNVPSGPFVMVNMAAGAAPVPLAKFVLGTAVGTVPKIILLVYFGGNLGELLASGDLRYLVAAGGLVLLWWVIARMVRRALRGQGPLLDEPAVAELPLQAQASSWPDHQPARLADDDRARDRDHLVP
jgi:uncharacterized membrane protein YdjX (TVP38/TMEM64 family)